MYTVYTFVTEFTEHLSIRDFSFLMLPFIMYLLLLMFNITSSLVTIFYFDLGLYASDAVDVSDGFYDSDGTVGMMTSSYVNCDDGLGGNISLILYIHIYTCVHIYTENNQLQ